MRLICPEVESFTTSTLFNSSTNVLHLRINAHASVNLIWFLKGTPCFVRPCLLPALLDEIRPTSVESTRPRSLGSMEPQSELVPLKKFCLHSSGFIPRKAGATSFHGLLKVPEHSQGSARSSKDLSATLPGGCIWLGDHECTASFPSTIPIFGIFPTPPLPLLPLWMYCLS